MTIDTEVETTPRPKPARRSPARRPAAAPDTDNSGDLLAEIRAMRAEIEELKKGGTRFIESEPPPKPVLREANPESLSDFSRKLLARTHAVPENFRVDREPAYNVPLRWYFRTDGEAGTYVQLQGDAKNRALYEDLGFALLTPEETAEYLKNERPGQVRLEQTRAALINGLRQLVKREAVLSGYIDDFKWDESLADMSIERLEEEWHNLCGQTANPKRRLPTAERHRAEQEPQLVGVETKASTSLEDLQRKLNADGSQARTSRHEIEVTRANAHMFS
jgi:hypothetical protein